MKHSNRLIQIASVIFHAGLLAFLPASIARAESALPSVQAITSDGSKAGKQITFEGFVTGVCRNGGKKVFIHDRNREIPATLRVDRTDSQPAFEPSLVGKTLRVTGILRELRIDAAYLDSWEAKVKGVAAPVSAKGNTTQDHCTEACAATEGQKATLSRIAALRAKLAKQKNGYISNYWVDGISWETLDNK